MGNSYGVMFRMTIFGQSHSPAIGVTMEGLPAGFAIDMDRLQAFLDRRAPGRDSLSTPRREEDRPEFVSGLVDGVTCGAPVTALIRNTNVQKSDYDALRCIPRPGHADFAAMAKYGKFRDATGGGQFSGRLTAPLCIAGGICLQLLEERGITIKARASGIGGESDETKFRDVIAAARENGDSVGGTIECVCENVPAGVGEPMFAGMENKIAQAVFGIPAIKGIAFGAGFDAAKMRGSACNDPFYFDGENVKTEKNDHGGILGGITSGMPIVFRVCVKPTPSIAIEQKSVDMRAKCDTTISVKGRHDPCIVLRAVPCVEAACAAAVYDALLESGR